MSSTGTDVNRSPWDEFRPSGATRGRADRSRTLVHVVGAVAYAGALVFGFVAALIIEVLTSYSGDAPSAFERITLFLGLLSVSTIVTSAPAVTGVIARRTNTAAVPWYLVAAITALYTVGVTLSSHPLHLDATTHF